MGTENYYTLSEEDRDQLAKLVEPEVLKAFEAGRDATEMQFSEELGLVFGYAVVTKVNGEDYYDLNIDRNKDGTFEVVPELVQEFGLVKSAADFSLNTKRAGNEMHKGPDKGRFPFIFPLVSDVAKALGIRCAKHGLLVGYIPPADVLEKFRSGEYTGFSIEGRKLAYQDIEDA